MKLHLEGLESPLGGLLLVTDDQEQVRALDFADHQARLHRGLHDHSALANWSVRRRRQASPRSSGAISTAT